MQNSRNWSVTEEVKYVSKIYKAWTGFYIVTDCKYYLKSGDVNGSCFSQGETWKSGIV